jgi:hypothetical protein
MVHSTGSFGSSGVTRDPQSTCIRTQQGAMGVTIENIFYSYSAPVLLWILLSFNQKRKWNFGWEKNGHRKEWYVQETCNVCVCNIGAGQVHSTGGKIGVVCVCVRVIIYAIYYICRHSHSAFGRSQCMAPSLTLFLLFSSHFLFEIEQKKNKIVGVPLFVRFFSLSSIYLHM